MRTFVFILLIAIAGIFAYTVYRNIIKGREFVSIMANRTIPPSAKADAQFYDWCIINYEQLAFAFHQEYPEANVSTDQGAMFYYMFCEKQYYNFSDVIEESRAEDEAELEEIDRIEENKRRFKSD